VPLSSLLSRFRRTRSIRASWPKKIVHQWLVLQQNDNPSTDYYIRSRLHETGLPVSYKNLDKDLPSFGDLAPGTGVIVVRYLNSRWVKALHTHRSQLSLVAYFMDDDLLHPQHWAGLPRAYIKKLNKHCGAFTQDIQNLSSEYWFSTEALRDRYPFYDAEVLAPKPLLIDIGRSFTQPPLHETGPIQMFYHGSTTHESEMNWLYPIIEKLLHRCTDLHFEIIGNHAINQKFRHLPRTRILHPLSWANYISHCHSLNGHIGLAPILPSPFNAGRSHSKIYDIARCGAVGVYSDPSPYIHTITHDKDGLLLKNDPNHWVEAIGNLVADRVRLNNLRQTAMTTYTAPSFELDQVIRRALEQP
jgi:hypothetical protein